MAKPYYLLIFVLAIAIAYSQSQTSGSGSAAGQATPANNAGSIYGNSTSGNQQAPGQSNVPSSQPLPGTTQSAPAATGTQPAMKPGSATDASGGGVAGAAGSGTGTGQAQVAETPNPSANPPVSDSELQSQIQNALSKEPTLSGDSVRVSVAEDSIEMSGNVATPREKLTASRIVQSYAGNKKVVSHVTIGAHSGANPSTPTATRDNANPSANPEPNKGTPPAARQPPQH